MFVGVDLETTGSDKQLDDIIEIGCSAWAVSDLDEGAVFLGEFCKRCKPTVTISSEAFAVHGIADSDLINESDFTEIVQALNEWLETLFIKHTLQYGVW